MAICKTPQQIQYERDMHKKQAYDRMLQRSLDIQDKKKEEVVEYWTARLERQRKRREKSHDMITRRKISKAELNMKIKEKYIDKKSTKKKSKESEKIKQQINKMKEKKKKKPKEKSKTRKDYIHELDELISVEVRLLRCNENGDVPCYTCPVTKPITEMHNGHYYQRNIRSLRRDIRNCRPQCYGCNVMKKGNYPIYAERLSREYGDKGWQELKEVAHRYATGELHAMSTPEIQEEIINTRTRIKLIISINELDITKFRDSKKVKFILYGDDAREDRQD